MSLLLYNKDELSIQSRISSGTFGICYSTYDKDNNYYVTKRNIGTTEIEHCMSIRELDILNKLKSPFVVDLKGVSFENPIKCNRPLTPIKEKNTKTDLIYFHFEKADYDGHNLIKSNAPYVELKYAVIQLIAGLEFIHNNNVCHRDIKPENLLWYKTNGHRRIKYCDFGVSNINTNQENTATHKVTTSWYRAPEISLGNATDSFSSDVWSLGCVFYELFQKSNFKALFQVGEDSVSALLHSTIINCPDLPDQKEVFSYIEDLTLKGTLKEAYKTRTKLSIKTMLTACKIDENEFNNSSYGGTYDQFLDLIIKMLKFWPKDRIKTNEIFNHPYFLSCKNIINKERSSIFYNLNLIPYNITIEKTIGFNAILDIVYEAFNKKTSLEISSYRVFFMAIDIFIRYIEYLKTDFMENYNLLIESADNSRISFFSCLYISIKYFSTNFHPHSILKIMPKSQYYTYNKEDFEKFEIFLIKNVLKYNIYRQTLFEYADKFNKKWSGEEIKDLLLFYKDLNFNGNINQLYQMFINRNLKSHMPYILKNYNLPLGPVTNTLPQGMMNIQKNYNENNFKVYPSIKTKDNKLIIDTTSKFNSIDYNNINYTSKAVTSFK